MVAMKVIAFASVVILLTLPIILSACASSANIDPVFVEQPQLQIKETSYTLEECDYDEQDMNIELWIPGEQWEVKLTIDDEIYSIQIPLAQYCGMDRWEQAPDLKGVEQLEITQVVTDANGLVYVDLIGFDAGEYYVEFDGGEGPGWAGNVEYEVNAEVTLEINLATGKCHISVREVADDPVLYNYDIDEIPYPNERGFVVQKTVVPVYSEYSFEGSVELYRL